MEECYQCTKWKYNEYIERKYGEGTGICEASNQPKGCNHSGCLLFERRTINEKN